MVSRTYRFLTFTLDQHLCAIPARDVREINHISQLSTEAADPLPGSIKLRDLVLPLINFRQNLGLSFKASNSDSRVIILESPAGLVGISVDSVQSVIDLPSIPMDFTGDANAPIFESIEIRTFTLILIDIQRAIDPSLSNLADSFRSATAQLTRVAS